MHTLRGGIFFHVVILFTISAQENISRNIELVGQLQTRGIDGYSNCWGYNAPDDKEYAIIGCLSGTQIIDITTDTLKEVAFIPGPFSSWREMKVYQHYAYVVTEGNGAGLQIIDLDSLKLVNTLNTAQVPSGHTISIEGKYLYINGGRYKNGGIVVLDLTDPVNPAYVGEYQTQYVHDCEIKNDTIYAAAIYGDGLDIIDATDKSNIQRINLVHYPYAGTHNTAVSVDGKYAFTTDEINSDPSQNGNVLRVWDKSDIGNVKLVGTYVATPKTIAHNVHVKGNFAFVSHYTEGLRIVDIKNPEIPVEVAYYDTYPGSAHAYEGNWGVFPYFESNKIIASDMSGGLFVFKFSGQDGSIKVARTICTVIDTSTGLPISGAEVNVAGYHEPLFTDANGIVNFGSLDDTVSITLSKSTYQYGYPAKHQDIISKFDSTVTRTVYMKQFPSGSLEISVTNKTTSQLIKDFKLKITNTPVQLTTDSTGKAYVPALLGETNFTVTAVHFGYKPDSSSIQIVGGQVNNMSIQVEPFGLDDFEFDMGWTVGSSQDSGSTGIWDRGKPNVTYVGFDTLQPAYDHSENGFQCFVTGNSGGATDYVDYRTTLTSPLFDPTLFNNPVFLYWVYFNSRSSVMDDTLYTELTNDDGLTWTVAETMSGKHPSWVQHRVIVKNVISVSNKMKIRFVAQDGGISSVFDVSVDDVEFGDNLQLSIGGKYSFVPDKAVLNQNYPNPFNPSTTISYQIPFNSTVSLKVYDLLGKEIASLVNAEVIAGNHSVYWNASGNSSGVYFYKIVAGNYVAAKKLLLMK